MFKLLLATAIGLASAPTLAQSAEVAAGDWSNIPTLVPARGIRMADQTMQRIDDLLKAGKCARFGKGKHTKMDVAYLVKFGAGDTVSRIVVQRLDCPELESLIAGVIQSNAREGLLTGTGENRTGWYRSEFSYYSI